MTQPPAGLSPRARATLAGGATLGNALCALLGCVALVLPPERVGPAIAVAAGFVFLAFVLDRLDGTLARRLGVESPFGAQLDSLCDVLSFGLLPALLLVSPAVSSGPSTPGTVVRVAVAACYLAAVIVRLARFTLAATGVPDAAPVVRMVIAGERHYHGLPSPAAAMAVASAVLLEAFGPAGALLDVPRLVPPAGHGWITVLVSAGAAVAMVRRWPYADPPRAFASGHWPRMLLVALVAVAVAGGAFTAMTMFAVVYLGTGPLLARRLPDDHGAAGEAG